MTPSKITGTKRQYASYSDEPKISVVTAFWQLANSPASNLLDDKNVIANMDANQEGVLEISAEDLHHITHEFSMHLPSIIKKMQCNDIPTAVARVSQSFFKPAEKKDACVLSENRPNYSAI